jgi:hypothetical protein
MKGFGGVQIDMRDLAAHLLWLGGGKTLALANTEDLLKRAGVPLSESRKLVYGGAALPAVFFLNPWTVEPNPGPREEMSR